MDSLQEGGGLKCRPLMGEDLLSKRRQELRCVGVFLCVCACLFVCAFVYFSGLMKFLV